jgi:hypothetical protein
MSMYHFLKALIASSLDFNPQIHQYPVAASRKTTAWLHPSMDLTDDENESICTW